MTALLDLIPRAVGGDLAEPDIRFTESFARADAGLDRCPISDVPNRTWCGPEE